MRPLRAFGSPVLDLCEPKPYVAHQAMFDASFPHGWWYYFRACDVAELSDDVIDVMVEHGRRIVSPITSVALCQMGGAVARVGEAETAFNGRDAAFTFNINGNSETAEGFEAEREWARAFWSALQPHHTSVYVNFLMDEGEERIRQAYGRREVRAPEGAQAHATTPTTSSGSTRTSRRTRHVVRIGPRRRCAARTSRFGAIRVQTLSRPRRRKRRRFAGRSVSRPGDAGSRTKPRIGPDVLREPPVSARTPGAAGLRRRAATDRRACSSVSNTTNEKPWPSTGSHQ